MLTIMAMRKMLFLQMRALGRRRAFQGAVSLAIGGMLLWLALTRVDLQGVNQRLQQVQPVWLILAIAAYWVALGIRSWRWRIILSAVRRLRFGQVFPALVIGY